MRQVYSRQLALATGFLVIAVVVVFALIQSPEVLDSPKLTAVKAAGPIPHPVEGYENCAGCHGPEGSVPYPSNHLGWANEICTRCHSDSASAASARRQSGE